MIQHDKCKSVITNCNVIYTHITVVFLDMCNVEKEVNISISFVSSHPSWIFPNVQCFHKKQNL